MATAAILQGFTCYFLTFLPYITTDHDEIETILILDIFIATAPDKLLIGIILFVLQFFKDHNLIFIKKWLFFSMFNSQYLEK